MRELYSDNIGKEVPDEQVRFFDGILIIILEDERCRHIILNAEFDDPISLADIAKKYKDVDKVIFEGALRGWVYSYGNHEPDEWELVGETCGYA